ncbi:MAG TPA: glycosyl hydrolase [Blastocatellia bacterium]|nr:glycosyl hydrolase [Blastocatellia bacterium]
MSSVERRDVVVLVGTRKGLFILNARNGSWAVEGPHFLGSIIHHAVLDPRDGKTLMVAQRTGHLGHTVFRSTDWGETWTESTAPPAFAKAEDGGGRAVDHVFWLTPGHASEPGVWYAGSSPQGLFRSEDGGATWAGVDGFNANPNYLEWTGGPQDGTPDGPKLHSIIVDPRDKSQLYISMSSGGTFESSDRGATWKPFNKGVAALFRPEPDPEYGHDPHCVVQHPANLDRFYQQNHCGIYRIDRPAERWTRIGDNMPTEVGDIGFPIVVHPRDPDTVWVFPMDGTEVWPRTSIGGRPAAYRSKDAGASWQRQDNGLPKEQAWFTVKRQCFATDQADPVGLYFGTTSGEIWASADEGDSWQQIAAHLPHVYSVETAVR